MRTTMIIEDTLLREAKRRAMKAGISVSELINRTLRDAFAARSQPAQPPLRMVTFGAGEPRLDHQPGDFQRAIDEEDAGALRGR